MSAIFGVIGDCSESELDAMGGRLAHKGRHIEIWSPEENVHLGEVRNCERGADECPVTASSLHTGINWSECDPRHFEDGQRRDEYRRAMLSRALGEDPVAAATHLDGFFAYAHWDAGKKRLILAVDRAGFERLYYARTPDALAFASDYKALLALPDILIAPAPNAVQYAIAVSTIDVSTTLAAGIQRVPQGHTAFLSRMHSETKAFWQPRMTPQSIGIDAAGEQLRAVLTRQIQQSLLPYSKIGLTLSGGMDSTGLLALIRRIYPDKPVSTYTIGNSEGDPEVIRAREAADCFGTSHSELIFEPTSIIKDLPALVWLAEEQAGREEAVLQYQVERYLLEREEVVVGGHGADMVFAGMPRHRLVRMAERIPLARRAATELFQQTQSGVPPESLPGKLASWLLYRGSDVMPPRVTGSSEVSRVRNPKSLDDFMKHTICEMPEFHGHSATQSLAPVETLFPYLSIALLEFSMQLPAKHKASVLRQKIVLRRALAPILPSAIGRRGKMIQRVRHDQALTEVLEQMADVLLSEASIIERGLISEAYVSQLRTKAHSSVYSGKRLSRLWMLLVCEIWCRTFVDNRGSAPLDLGIPSSGVSR